MSAPVPVSVPEIVKVYLAAAMAADNVAPTGGIVVGPMTDTEQQDAAGMTTIAGAVSIVEAGTQKAELYAPLVHQRVQIRCLASRLADADHLGRMVYPYVHKVGRKAITTADGHTWLMHQLNCVAGPSTHFDTQETWESLMFLSVMVGTQYIS